MTGTVYSRIALGVVALMAYFGFFAAGMLLSSKPYRDRLSPPPAPAYADASLATAAVASTNGPAMSFSEIEWWSLGGAALIYTPLNVAFLTLLAGLVGGCASSITYETSTRPATDAGAVFRRESPFASMFRSFLVYLACIAGIFITGDRPFEDGTAEQYVRFAATVSLFAFIVGYDPTKFQQFLDFVPNRKEKQESSRS